MKKNIAIAFLIVALLVSTIYIVKDPSQGGTFVKSMSVSDYEITMKQDLLCIMLAYPGYIKDIEYSDGERTYVVLQSGKKLLYDDKRKKNGEEKIASPDIQDMLEQPYPLETTNQLMDKYFDPGRVRVYGLLKEVYGGSQQQIEAQLENVKAAGRSFQFSKSNGASTALKNAMQELVSLANQDRKVAAAAFPTSGTFNYRVISGTNRLSPHAFGIAIDLARDNRDYWQWATREQGQKRLDTYPKELVEIFERNNFVWGGKWGHFDILHFEYRPEIIMKARYFGSYKAGDPWYKGAPESNETMEAVRKIEEVFQ